MGRIKIVLLFNEEDERQREVGEYLKKQQRCKTAFITEVLYSRLHGMERAVPAAPPAGAGKSLEETKQALLRDEAFLKAVSECLNEHKAGKEKQGQETSSGAETIPDEGLDIDEDMLLAGLSIFESQM